MKQLIALLAIPLFHAPLVYGQMPRLPDFKDFKRPKCSDLGIKDIDYITQNHGRVTYTSRELSAIMEEQHRGFVERNRESLTILNSFNPEAPQISIKQKLQICQMKEELLGRSEVRSSGQFSSYFSNGRMSEIMESNQTELSLSLLHAFEIAYVHRKDAVAADILNLINIANPMLGLQLREVVGSTNNTCLTNKFPEFKKPSSTEYSRIGLSSSNKLQNLLTEKASIDLDDDVLSAEQSGNCDIEGLRPGLLGFAIPKNFDDAQDVVFPNEKTTFCERDPGMISDGTPPVLYPNTGLPSPLKYANCTVVGGGCHGWTSAAGWQARQQIANQNQASYLSMEVGKNVAMASETLKFLLGKITGENPDAEAAWRAKIEPDTLIGTKPGDHHPTGTRDTAPADKNILQPTKRYDPLLKYATECSISNSDLATMRREATKEYRQDYNGDMIDLSAVIRTGTPEYDQTSPNLRPIGIAPPSGNMPEFDPAMPIVPRTPPRSTPGTTRPTLN